MLCTRVYTHYSPCHLYTHRISFVACSSSYKGFNHPFVACSSSYLFLGTLWPGLPVYRYSNIEFVAIYLSIHQFQRCMYSVAKSGPNNGTKSCPNNVYQVRKKELRNTNVTELGTNDVTVLKNDGSNDTKKMRRRQQGVTTERLSETSDAGTSSTCIHSQCHWHVTCTWFYCSCNCFLQNLQFNASTYSRFLRFYLPYTSRLLCNTGEIKVIPKTTEAKEVSYPLLLSSLLSYTLPSVSLLHHTIIVPSPQHVSLSLSLSLSLLCLTFYRLHVEIAKANFTHRCIVFLQAIVKALRTNALFLNMEENQVQ